MAERLRLPYLNEMGGTKRHHSESFGFVKVLLEAFQVPQRAVMANFQHGGTGRPILGANRTIQKCLAQKALLFQRAPLANQSVEVVCTDRGQDRVGLAKPGFQLALELVECAFE